jgi:hypothetical protein
MNFLSWFNLVFSNPLTLIVQYSTYPNVLIFPLTRNSDRVSLDVSCTCGAHFRCEFIQKVDFTSLLQDWCTMNEHFGVACKPEGGAVRDRLTSRLGDQGGGSIRGEGGCGRACNRVQTSGTYSLRRELSRDPKILARGTELETYARVFTSASLLLLCASLLGTAPRCALLAVITRNWHCWYVSLVVVALKWSWLEGEGGNVWMHMWWAGWFLRSFSCVFTTADLNFCLGFQFSEARDEDRWST